MCLYENKFSHLTRIQLSQNRDLALVRHLFPIQIIAYVKRDRLEVDCYDLLFLNVYYATF